LQSASRKRITGHPTKLSKKQKDAALQDRDYLDLLRYVGVLRKRHGPASCEYLEARRRLVAKERKVIEQALTQFQEEWRAEQYQHIVSTCGKQDSAPMVDYEFERLLRLDRERSRLVRYIGIDVAHEENEKLPIVEDLLNLAYRRDVKCYLPGEEPTTDDRCPVVDCRKVLSRFVQ
jgi:hypothetical protein